VYCTFLKQPFQNQPKSVILRTATYTSPKVGQAMQLELSKCTTSYCTC